MAYFSSNLANIEDCLELLEKDKFELKLEIETLKQELDSVGECKQKYLADTVNLLQEEVEIRKIELSDINTAVLEIEAWLRDIDQYNIPKTIFDFSQNFCIQQRDREDLLNLQIRHLKRELKRKLISLSSKKTH